MDRAVHIAAEAGLPYTGLRGVRPDELLVGAVPLAWARRERAMPLRLADGRLTLAATRPDPDLDGLLAALPHVRSVEVVIAPEREIDAALSRALVDPASPRRLGERLVAHGIATAEEIEAALAEQARTGGRLGHVLLGRGVAAEHELQAALAEQLDVPLVDLGADEPDPAALALLPEDVQRRLRCVPLAADHGALFVACAEPFGEDERALLRERTGLEPREFLAAGADVDALLLRVHGERWAREACDGLRRRFPAESSIPVATATQVALVVVAVLAAGAALVLTPAGAAVALAALAAAVTIPPALALVALSVAGLARRPPHSPTAAGTPPTASVLLLVEARDGAQARAAATLAALDHPAARLEVLLLAREDEPEALRAAAPLAAVPGRRLVPVPATVTPTDAGALAFGLLLARGELVATLRAGDIPDPGLLATAAAALAAGGGRLAAVQARRVVPAGGVLAGWSAAEHGAWHDLVAPALGRHGLPLPAAAGGLVARATALRETGGWDAAADPDGAGLALRLHKAGFRVGALGAGVSLPPPGGTAAWLESRAAGWRGLAQAWLVQLRHPLRATRRLGLAGTAAGTVLGAGAVLAPLAWPAILIAVVAGALDQAGALDAMLPRAAVLLAAASAAATCAAVLVAGVGAAARRRSGSILGAALLAPAAWTAGALAAWLGLAELVARLGRAGDGPSGGRRGRW